MNSYELSRIWFDWAFENPSKITPSHGILYFFCIEHCNRLGWKKEFGLPTTMAKEAIGIRSYNTYINTLNDLVEWGFIKLIEKSKNQYSSNIIALSNFNKALDKATNKALDKALIKHGTKQDESIDSIDKQLNNKQLNNKTIKANAFMNYSLIELYNYLQKDKYNSQAIECYWNLFATKYKIPVISNINDARRKKLKTRSKEDLFDITKILTAAKDQKWLLEQTFFTFDWMIESESNYTKVLEGNYKEKPKEEDKTNFKING